MDLAQGLIIITSVHLLAAASPGPDFVLVSQQTLSNGKRAGLLCSIGIALGPVRAYSLLRLWPGRGDCQLLLSLCG